MAIELTSAQREAVMTRNRNILVSAAAGSGKTGVLTRRVIALLKEGRNLDELLVLTFTRAAAGEMRGRIRNALFEAMDKADDEQRRHLQRQVTLLGNAAISTLDSFFIQIVRNHYQAIPGLDPQFRLFATGQEEIFRGDLLREFMDEYYGHPEQEKRTRFWELARIYGSNRDDEGLRTLIENLIERGSTRGDLEQWLHSSLQRFGELDFWYQATMARVHRHVQLVCNMLKELYEYNNRHGGSGRHGESLAQDIETIEPLLHGDWEQLARADVFPRLHAKAKDDNAEIAAIVQSRRKEIKEYYSKHVSSLLQRDFQDYAREIALVAPRMEVLVDITLEFHARYRKQQLKKNLFGFADVANMARQILVENPALAQEYRHRYYEVLVDEYQDVNPVQEEIISYLADRDNLFVVGDVKQSIYGFRFADHALFNRRSQTYRLDDARGYQIDLNQNFRSRQSILDLVNFVFSQLLDEDIAGIAYGETEALKRGADYAETEAASVSMVVIRPEEGEVIEEDDYAAQGRYIAAEIERMMAENMTVGTRGEERPLRYSDIAVLMRSVKGRGEELIAALKQCGIPVISSVRSGYTDGQEVRLLLSLLAVLDNPRQDIPLAAVMRSPLFSFDEDALTQVARRARGENIWSRLKEREYPEPLQENVTHFVATVERWRDMAKVYAVGDLLRLLIAETEYTAFWGGLPDGRQRIKRIGALQDAAASYQGEDSGGLFGFLRYMKKIQDIGKDELDENEENANCVIVSTIHKSKGLEYPVVFVANLEHQLASNHHSAVELDGELGFGPQYVNLETYTASPTLPRLLIAAKQKDESFSEDLRLLYVAMTRAREKLILIGCDKKNNKVEKWLDSVAYCESQHLPADKIRGGISFLQWLCFCLARRGERGCRIPYQEAEVKLEFVAPPPPRDAVMTAQQLGGTLSPVAFDRLAQALAMEEPRALPAKMSVTDLIRDEKRDLLPRPTFLMGVGAMRAADRGTAFHHLMEHLPLDRPWDAASLEAYKETLVEREGLERIMAEAVDDASVLYFLNSDYGAELRKAEIVWRELDFTVALPACELGVGESEESIILQGAIDMVYQCGNGYWVLLDYKTGHGAERDEDAFMARYRRQIDLYAKALLQLFGIRVEEKVFYLSDEKRFLKRK